MSALQYEAPLRELSFVLRDVLRLPRRWRELPRFDDFDLADVEAAFDQAACFATEQVMPLNPVADAVGCVRSADGSVATPPGFPAAYALYRELGWTAASAPVEEGGLGLPRFAFAVVYEMLSGASHAFMMYAAAGHCAADCLRHSASPRLREQWLPLLADGSVLATMCLSEPQAGSDVGLARTSARPRDDGTYAIHGTKIFASGGEHDLTPQILHLVLARLPDAPAGTRGLSLFAVPRLLEGGQRNAVVCDGIEHKMGLHGSATCTMRFEGATAWLVGEPHCGLRAMFPMMNEARLLSGLQANGMAEVALQNALRWSGERRQGRVPGTSGTVRLIDHPDVQRMLLTQRCWTEGGRMLALQVACWIDEAEAHPDADVRRERHALVGLLTPVVKAFLTENAQVSLSLALQVHGGYGFIRETGIEQLVRDARVTTLYEGTTGIQSQDLLLRKVIGDGGQALALLRRTVGSQADEARSPFDADVLRLGDRIVDLAASLSLLEATTAGSTLPRCTPFLRLVGLWCFAWLWARAYAAAQDGAKLGDPWLRGKQACARYYFDHLLPEAQALMQDVEAPATSWTDALSR